MHAPFSGEDGPYILEGSRPETVRLVYGISEIGGYAIKEREVPRTQPISVRVDNQDHDQFEFCLRESHPTPPAVYPRPEQMFVLSDIEGNFNALYSLLVGNHIMDKNYQCLFGHGHLILTGDVLDRGPNATQCLWLIYKLEQEAESQGGMAHYILGNHEAMYLQGDYRYLHPKYPAFAQSYSSQRDFYEACLYYYQTLFNENAIVVQWLKSKNILECLGDLLFAHGGISPQLIAANLTMDEINGVGREFINHPPPSENLTAKLVHEDLGPLWYRGLADEYAPTGELVLDRILAYFMASKIIIGHSIVKRIAPFWDGKVIRVDVQYPQDKFTGAAQGLLIRDNQFYRVNDHGQKTLILDT